MMWKPQRYNATTSGYRFDKILFFSIAFLLLAFVGLLAKDKGLSQHPQLTCNAERCINPLLSGHCSGLICSIDCNEAWCTQKYLTRGSYGTPPPITQTNFLFICLGMFLLAFVFNHLLHNRGKKFDLGLTNSPMMRVATKANNFVGKIQDDEEKKP